MTRKNIFNKKRLVLEGLDNGEFCLFRRKGLEDEIKNGRKYDLKGTVSLIETIQKEIDEGNYNGKFRMTKRVRIELEYHNAK